MDVVVDELSVRTRDRGGSVNYNVRARGRMSRLTSRRIIILVHGFNVDAKKARKTYQDFLTRLQAQTWPAQLDSFGAFWGLHWPGDHRSRVASLLTFPVRVEGTRSVAHGLTRFIVDYLGPDQEVFFIAHSLGCRVVLETLHEIAERKSPSPERAGASVQGTFLMAAAVPYDKCDKRGEFYQKNRGVPPELGDPFGPRLGAYDSVPRRGRGTRGGRRRGGRAAWLAAATLAQNRGDRSWAW